MQLAREVAASFAGGASDSLAPDEYAADQAQVMLNFAPSKLGHVARYVRGLRQLSIAHHFDPADETVCFGAIEFYTAAGVRQIIASWGGLNVGSALFLSTDGGVTFAPITGGAALEDDYWSFAIYREGSNNILAMANGGASAYQWNGSALSAISNIPSGTKYLAVMGDRLIAAGGDGVTVAASKVGDIDNGYGATDGGYTVKATTHDGDTEITGLFTLGSTLLVFKRKSVGYVEGFGYQTLQVEAGARGLSRSVGCVAHRSIAPCGDQGVMWLSERGFEFYSPGGVVQLASVQQQRFIDRINYAAVRAFPGLPASVWDAGRHEYVCAVPVSVGIGDSVIGQYRNTWSYVFRPPTGDRRAAAYMLYPTDEDSSTVVVDDDGMLAISEGDRTGFMGFVNERGMLELGHLPDPGLWMEVNENTGMLEFSVSRVGPSSLFVMDTGQRQPVVAVGTYAGGVAVRAGDPAALPAQVIDGGNMSIAGLWVALGGGVSIAAGVATWNGVDIGQLVQGFPVTVGMTFTVRFTVSGTTAEQLTLRIGGNFASPANYGNGTHVATITITALSGTFPHGIIFSGTAPAFDGSLDNVSVEVTYPADAAQVGILRTRPFTFGDEFARKKAKRAKVLAAQPLALDATLYAVVDGARQAGHEIELPASSTTVRREERLGGRGRTLQVELHAAADVDVDGLELVAALIDEVA